MAIVRWNDPFYRLATGRLWPELFLEEGAEPVTGGGLNIYETENDLVVEAPVPGITADELDVQIEGDVITIKAEHEETEEEEQERKFVYRTGRKAKYYYSCALPTSVKADKAEAEVENGIVKVTVPKAEESKSKAIKVKTK